MSVYDHPTRPGWQMIKISHGRSKPADYVPVPLSREDAKTYERELRGIVDTTNPGFLDKLAEFKLTYKNEISAGTYGDFLYAMKRLQPFFSPYKILQITPILVEHYKKSRMEDTYLPGKAGQLQQKDTPEETAKRRPVMKRTVNRELSYLSKYLQFCGSDLKIVKFRKKDCVPVPAEPMSMDTMDSILTWLPEPIKQLVQLMAYNGIRRTEAFKLRSEDADKDGTYIRVWGKGGKWRVAPVEEPQLQKDIAAAKKKNPNGYLFPNPQTQKPYKNINKSLQNAADKAGVTQRIYNHLFRHSFATALVEEGENMAVIQELMGHADIKQTRDYIKLATSHTRRGTARLIGRHVANVANDESSK